MDPKTNWQILFYFAYSYIGDDKLRISVNDDFPIEDFFGKDSKQKLIFKEGNQVSPLGSDIKLSNGIKAGFEVVLNKRGGKNLGDGKVHILIMMHSELKCGNNPFCQDNALFALNAKINVFWHFFEWKVSKGDLKWGKYFKKRWF